MNFGSLFVELPDGRELEFPVNKPQILIGRTPDNDLVISHPTISRRHVRLFIEPDLVIIEDMGSTNGTYFDDQQLDPLQPHPITPQQPIFLGDVRIYYRSSHKTDDISEEIEDQTDKSGIDIKHKIKSNQFVSLTVRGPDEPISPGSTRIAKIHLHNTSISEHEAIIRVSGLPQNWYRLEHNRLKLNANEIVEIPIYIHPPRFPEVIAGTHTFKVTVYSTHHGRGPSTQAKLEILLYHNFKLKLEPKKGTSNFILVAENQSNFGIDYRFYGTNNQQDLEFEFQQSSIHLEAGQIARIPLLVTPHNRQLLGRTEPRSFFIVGNPGTESFEQTEIEGCLELKPIIPNWSIPLSFLIFACFIIAVVLIYPRICTQFPGFFPFCPQVSPHIQVLNANPSTIRLGETVKLEWLVDHAETIELLAPAIDLTVQIPYRGTQEFFLYQSTSFILRAENAFGTVEESITIKVSGALPGIQEFSANPNAVVLGQTENLSLTWSVLDADTVIIENASGESLPLEGEISIPVPKHDTTYTIIAHNERGISTDELTVYVISPGCQVSNLDLDEMLVVYGGPSIYHPPVTELENGTMVKPFGRTATSDWLIVKTDNQEGWLSADFVSCIVGLHVFPVIPFDALPTPPAEQTP